MLLWRIASKTIPVKEILDQRMGLDNQVCALCQEAPKTSCHLFCHCPIARAIWFTSCQGMRVHDHNLTNSADIIKLVLNPPIPSAQEADREHITITLAFTLDEIWLLRNQFTFEDSKIDSLSSSNRIDVIFVSRSFPSVSFVWVRRVCNAAAHEAAKFALRAPVSSCFSLDSLPLALVNACKADFPPCSSLV